MKTTLLRTLLFAFVAVQVAACGTSRPVSDAPPERAPLQYVVNLNDRSGDTFKVTLRVDDLEAANAVYQFAATAPGTYQVMDIGRYVRSFEAVDAAGTVIPSSHVSTNQWEISDPEAVTEIRYAVADTWDAPVDEHPIYRMAGTSLEDDHALMSNQGVFGYPTGMQTRPIHVCLDKPADWIVGTALVAGADGCYLADDYDYLVDSPILAGTLSEASVDVGGADVEVYTYSEADDVTSDAIVASVQSILDAAGTFLGKLPVDHYAFLFHFGDISMGALEHSYSSTYVLADQQIDQTVQRQIPDIVAHEFLHVVTPLNIHSEVIEHFNFVHPTPSEHVWLYEGTTEWMAHASQRYAGLIDLDTYLQRMSQKMQANDQFDPSFTLSDIGLKSFTEKGQEQWANIYQRGAVFAELLNIQLLAHSNGQQGLREAILALSKRYGKQRAFSEAHFFDQFAAITYPGVKTFLQDYVRGTEPFPVEETFALVGVEYVPEEKTGEQVLTFGARLGASGDRLVVIGAAGPAADCGLKEGDVVMAVDDTPVTLQTARQALGRMQSLGADEPFTLTVQRSGGDLSLQCAKKMVDEVAHHVLRLDPNATPEQLALRAAWTRGG